MQDLITDPPHNPGWCKSEPTFGRITQSPSPFERNWPRVPRLIDKGVRLSSQNAQPLSAMLNHHVALLLPFRPSIAVIRASKLIQSSIHPLPVFFARFRSR